MDSPTLLGLMQGYFDPRTLPADKEFSELRPRELLKESLDVVEFVVHLEDKLGREIDMNELGEALLNKNFGELADEVSRVIATEEA